MIIPVLLCLRGPADLKVQGLDSRNMGDAAEDDSGFIFDSRKAGKASRQLGLPSPVFGGQVHSKPTEPAANQQACGQAAHVSWRSLGATVRRSLDQGLQPLWGCR